MYKFFLQCPGCFLILFIPIITYSQHNQQKVGDIPDTIHHNHGLILKEVVVKASPKVIVKRDTVVFSADAFMNNSEKVLEDLLKHIPGIEVAKDGTITVNGKKVERVLIEGEDLFKKDYIVLSKNLSADVIDKVQVIDNYTGNSLLKGFVNNNNKVINLTLKDKRKKILFGNISAGVGTAGRNDLSVNLISFMNKTKIYCLGTYVTTGRDPLPGIADQGNMEAMKSHLVNNVNYISLVNLYRLYRPSIDPEKINFNNARLLSSFISHRPSPKLTVRFSGWSFLDNNSLKQENNYQYNPDNGAPAISSNEYNLYNKQPFRAMGNIDIIYKCRGNAELQLSSVFNCTGALMTADRLSNNSRYYNKLKENSFSLDNTLTYTDRINNTNALVIESNFIHGDEKQNLHIEQYPAKPLPFTDLFPGSLYQIVSYPFDVASLSCRYMHIKKFWHINIYSNTTLHTQQLNSSLDTSYVIKQAKELDTFFNKDYLKRFTSTVGFTLFRQVKNIQLSASLSENFLYSCFITYGNQYNKLISCNLYPSINAGIKWKEKNQAIGASYVYDTKFPMITDIYEGYIFANDRSLQKGIRLFNKRPIHNFSFEYSYLYLPRQLQLYLFTSYSIINRIPVKNLQVTENYDFITQTPVSSAITYSLYSIGLDKFIKTLNAGVKLNTTISVSNYADAFNSANNRQIKSIETISQLSIRSAFQGIFNYNIGAIINYSGNRIRNGQNALFQNHVIENFLDLHFKCSERFRFTISNEYYYFNAINNERKNYYFSDFSIHYILQGNKVAFTLTGKNLTNNTQYINTQITNYYRQVQRHDLSPPYLLLQVNYRFR